MFIMGFFFNACEKDNPNASSSSNSNSNSNVGCMDPDANNYDEDATEACDDDCCEYDDITCNNDSFTISSDNYVLSSAVLTVDCDEYYYDEYYGYSGGGDCYYVLMLAGPGLDVTSYYPEGQGDLLIFNFDNIDIDNNLSGSYTLGDYDYDDYSVRMLLDFDYYGYDYDNYSQSIAGQVNLNITSSGLEMTFNFIDNNGNNVTGCYSGSLDVISYDDWDAY